MWSDTEPPSTEPLEPQFYAFPIIQSWSDIEVERGGGVWTETFTGVKVDDVAHPVTTPVNYPVVSVKRGCVSGNVSEIPREVRRIRMRATNPNSDLNLALGLSSCDFPLKLTSLNPPHASDPLPSSHFKISYHVRSFTALCIGTITFMSFVWGSWFFLAIAAKNWDSEGYTHLSPSNRGIEEVSRSAERFPDTFGWECSGG